jgi:hypothetical protein
MSASHHIDTPRSDRRTLIVLIASYFAILIALGSAIWFELPNVAASALLIAGLIVAVIVAVRAGRWVARSHASIPFRLRPSLSGRTVGVLALVTLASLAIACAKLIYPRSWPTTVNDALAILDEQVDAETKKELAYMAYDELIDLKHGWATSIRDRFGLASRNNRLLHDCDPEYRHPDSCASVIISRFWKRVRAAMPSAERLPLEALEEKMERVRVKSQQFKQQPLKEVVAFFNEAIRTQLPDSARFTIRYEPPYADEPVSASWHVMDNISLREALGIVTANTKFKVQKAPPDLLIEPD